MHVCPYGAMAIFILNKISLLEPKTQNRVRSALYFWLLDQRMLSADTLNAHGVSASGKVPQERRRRCWSLLVHTLSTSMARV